MNYDECKSLFNELNIELTQSQFDKYELYKKELLEWNEKINLTAITDENEIWLKHFIDSCTINEYVDSNSSLIDVGTGAGFPSLPLKIIRDDISLTLLDSLNKRLIFLQDVVNKLELNNIEFIHGRAEDIANDNKYREKFDVATARAVANLSTLSEYCLPFVKINGIFICMKAGNVDKEIEEAQIAIKTLGGKIEKIDKFNLPGSNIERTIIIFRKIKNTPLSYPRKAGIPSKQPIV